MSDTDRARWWQRRAARRDVERALRAGTISDVQARALLGAIETSWTHGEVDTVVAGLRHDVAAGLPQSAAPPPPLPAHVAATLDDPWTPGPDPGSAPPPRRRRPTSRRAGARSPGSRRVRGVLTAVVLVAVGWQVVEGFRSIRVGDETRELVDSLPSGFDAGPFIDVPPDLTSTRGLALLRAAVAVELDTSDVVRVEVHGDLATVTLPPVDGAATGTTRTWDGSFGTAYDVGLVPVRPVDLDALNPSRVAAVVDRVSRGSEPGTTVLEVGRGSGRFPGRAVVEIRVPDGAGSALTVTTLGGRVLAGG